MRLFGFAVLAAVSAIAGARINIAEATPMPATGGAAAPAPSPDAGEAVPNSRLIFLKPGANNDGFKSWVHEAIADNVGAEATIAEAAAGAGGEDASGAHGVQKEFKIETANFSVITGIFDDKFIQKVKDRPEVEGVFPNLIHHISETQVNPPNKGLPPISSRTGAGANYFFPDSAGEGVTVYILDTGVRVTHTDFEGRATLGMTAVSGTTTANDDNGHGTHVSAIVGGAAHGVAKKVSLVAVKVCSSAGKCTTQDIVEGVTWVINDSRRNGRGKSIANLSLGGVADAAVDRAVQSAMDAGVAFAAAAGNGNVDACTTSPGRVAGVVTVAATDGQGQKASFSNFGKCVDILAPGVTILSASNASDDATATLSGTSMSSPFAAGVLALIAGQGTFSVEELASALVQTGTKSVLKNLQDGTPDLLLFNGGQKETADPSDPPPSADPSTPPPSAEPSTPPRSADPSTPPSANRSSTPTTPAPSKTKPISTSCTPKPTKAPLKKPRKHIITKPRRWKGSQGSRSRNNKRGCPWWWRWIGTCHRG